MIMGEETKSPGGTKPSPSPSQDKSDQPQVSNAVNPTIKTENGEPAKPLGPPPRPAQTQGSNTPDLFATQQSGDSLSLEPNPFEQSFGNTQAESQSGGPKLPSVAALTSPQSLLPGQGGSPFNWGGNSLRSGPLSPAMLSGPTGDYFSETHHLRASFPTPNESSLRTGLTPGGGGSMFPAPSPGNGQALFVANPTPNTLEFQKTALNAAAKRGQPQTSQPPVTQSVTSQPQTTSALPAKADTKPAGPFDNHDNDAANGLYMLAQGRGGGQAPPQFPMAAPPQVTSGPSQAAVSSAAPPAPAATVAAGPQPALNTSPQMNNGGAVMHPSTSRGVSEAASAASEEDDQARPNTRGKRKTGHNPTSVNGRSRADSGKSNKRVKTHASAPSNNKHEDYPDSDEDMKMEHDDNSVNSNGKKLTDEEKRKNFLERNRVAALKCRQRKKQWLANLQNKVELYSQENDQLSAQITGLREEIVNLKTLLLAHKDCPVTQQQGLGQAFIPPNTNIDPGFNAVNPQMAAYGMPGGSMSNAQVMAPQSVDRRFA